MPTAELTNGVQLIPLDKQCHAVLTVVGQYKEQNVCVNTSLSDAHKEFADAILAGSRITAISCRDEDFTLNNPKDSSIPGLLEIGRTTHWAITYEN